MQYIFLRFCQQINFHSKEKGLFFINLLLLVVVVAFTFFVGEGGGGRGVGGRVVAFERNWGPGNLASYLVLGNKRKTSAFLI